MNNKCVLYVHEGTFSRMLLNSTYKTLYCFLKSEFKYNN